MALPRQLMCASLLAFTCLPVESQPQCRSMGCDASVVEEYADQELAYMSSNMHVHDTSVHMLQRVAHQSAGPRCRKRCHYHPKHDCRLICRVSCVQGRPVQHPKCKSGQTTTTTTTSKQFTDDNPPTENETCDLSSILSTTFDNLVENTIGQDVENPRMLFKDVVQLSKILKSHSEWANRKLDLTVVDASQKPRYVQHREENYVADPWGAHGGLLKKYVRDTRNMTGSYLGTIRIGIDVPGSYIFRMSLTDSETGEPAPLPLFPLTFYDIDGPGECIATCDATRVISLNTRLDARNNDNGCFVHQARGREVNLPKDFEDLTLTQASQSITYVYANKAEWDVQIHLSPQTPQRYFIMKSSSVLACGQDILVNGGTEHQWKNLGNKKADA